MWRVGLLCVTGLLAVAGCNNQSTQQSTVVELECEASGEPCRLSDVSLAVLERGEALGDQLLEMIGTGTSFAEALLWVGDQQDVVEADGDEVTIIFRVDGGRDVWVVDDITLAPVLGPSTGGNIASDLMTAQIVVGNEPPTKRALVLAPFKHEFGSFDDGAEVATLIRNTRGYAGNVVSEENATEDSTEVGISDFKGWQAYDVVHVTSHGKTFCSAGICSAVVYTGDSYSDARELLQITEAGVNTVKVVGSSGNLFAVGADFFRKQYPEGLEKTIVFFNACQTFGAGDFNLGISIIGDDSVFLGWSEAVHADIARSAALALFRSLSDTGVTTEDAWRTLGNIAVDEYTKKGRVVRAELQLGKREGVGLRMREIVFIEHPEIGGTLSDGAKIPFIGRVGDKVDEVIPYQVLVDGVSQDLIDEFMLTVILDGGEGKDTPLIEGQAIGEQAYRVTGDLSFRDLTGVETLTLHAAVSLPDKGMSEHTVSVVVGEEVNDGSDVWEGESTHVFVGQLTDQTRTTTVTARFEEVEPFNSSPEVRRFNFTGGQASWSISGSVQGDSGERCFYSRGPVEFDLNPVQNRRDGRLDIDTSSSPPSYSMFARTVGVEIRVAENCGRGAFTTRTRSVWVSTLDADSPTVAPDGNTISGMVSGFGNSWSWSFTRRAGQ